MPEVAYVLKGFPRLSELFVASEILRLEQIGLDLRLHVIKAPDEDVRTRSSTASGPAHLPAADDEPVPDHAPALAAREPAVVPPVALAASRAAGRSGSRARCGFTLAQSIRARKAFWALPRKLFVKELLLGVALADGLLDAPEVRHIHAHFAHGATTVAWVASMVSKDLN